MKRQIELPLHIDGKRTKILDLKQQTLNHTIKLMCAEKTYCLPYFEVYLNIINNDMESGNSARTTIIDLINALTSIENINPWLEKSYWEIYRKHLDNMDYNKCFKITTTVSSLVLLFYVKGLDLFYFVQNLLIHDDFDTLYRVRTVATILKDMKYPFFIDPVWRSIKEIIANEFFFDSLICVLKNFSLQNFLEIKVLWNYFIDMKKNDWLKFKYFEKIVNMTNYFYFYDFTVCFLTGSCFVGILKYLDEDKYEKLDEIYDMIQLVRRIKYKGRLWRSLLENFAKSETTYLKFKEIVLLSLKFPDMSCVKSCQIIDNILESSSDFSETSLYSQYMNAFERISSLKTNLRIKIIKLMHKYYYAITQLYHNFDYKTFLMFNKLGSTKILEFIMTKNMSLKTFTFFRKNLYKETLYEGTNLHYFKQLPFSVHNEIN